MMVNFGKERCPFCGWFLMVFCYEGMAYLSCGDHSAHMGWACSWIDDFPLMTEAEWKERQMKWPPSGGGLGAQISEAVNNGSS